MGRIRFYVWLIFEAYFAVIVENRRSVDILNIRREIRSGERTIYRSITCHIPVTIVKETGEKLNDTVSTKQSNHGVSASSAYVGAAPNAFGGLSDDNYVPSTEDLILGVNQAMNYQPPPMPEIQEEQMNMRPVQNNIMHQPVFDKVTPTSWPRYLDVDGSLDLYHFENTPNKQTPRKRERRDSDSETMCNEQSSPINRENFIKPAIRFTPWAEEQWHSLLDERHCVIEKMLCVVVVDKGIRYSSQDKAHIAHKKNQFQLTVHIEAQDPHPPRFVHYNGRFLPINGFQFELCAVQAEQPSAVIEIMEANPDRKFCPRKPIVAKEIPARHATRVIMSRLHFKSTTLNNHRKHNKPNPDQRYFLLVVKLFALTDSGPVIIQSFASEKIIVRAGHPGAFEKDENDTGGWKRVGEALVTHTPIVIGNLTEPVNNCDLTVGGDIFAAGRVLHPSDRNYKENILDKDGSKAIQNLQALRVVSYSYKPEIAAKWGLKEDQRHRTGLIAQQAQEILPDAVKDIGDYLMIDENRVFYETMLATQELCRLTGDLDFKIDEKVQEISNRLSEYAHKKKLLSSFGSNLDRSSMAYSQSSLSTWNNRKSKRRGSSEASCATTFTQITIGILVVVMTFCLLGMFSLYVLDWHHRNQGYHISPPKPSEAPGEMVAVDPWYIPDYQPLAPPLMPECLTKHCREYCCLTIENNSNHSKLEVHVPTSMAPTARSVPSSLPTSSQVAVTLKSGVYIHLPALNMTIDGRYCVDRSCDERRGRYTLFVPVSAYLPTMALDVQIMVPNGKLAVSCGYLTDFDHKQCRGNPYYEQPIPSVVEIESERWKLSIGTFSRSGYRFRVGYSTDVCHGDSVHGVFEEYNLVFYRTCVSKEVDPTISSR